MRRDLNYAQTDNVVYYDMALLVDVSDMMFIHKDIFELEKKTLHNVVNGMLDEDIATIFAVSSWSSGHQGPTNDKDVLHNAVDKLNIRMTSEYRVMSGLASAFMKFENSKDDEASKMIILFTEGKMHDFPEQLSEKVVAEIARYARENGIQIHCVDFSDTVVEELESLATLSGGSYYQAVTTEQMMSAISGITGTSRSDMDLTDSDGDGLYDVYEINGMRLSNGQIVYTDPNNPDTDGDGINDFDAMGGLPVVEDYRINGDVYSCTLNHSPLYGKLPSEFIYVDGTMNANGKQYYGEMEYIPYSESFRYNKYEKEKDINIFKEKRTVYGEAGVYKAYYDKLATMDSLKLLEYAAWGTYVACLVSLIDNQAGECIYRYVQGTGGSCAGLVEGSTREYIYATPRLDDNLFGVNSANKYFVSNMRKVREAVESVVNEYNTEAYISLSPETTWCGCHYNDCDGWNWEQNIDSLINIGAFGIYNQADAGVTVHCVYSPETNEYAMEYTYYLIDLYDFALLDVFNEMNALGLARCYELYGVAKGVSFWYKGDSRKLYWMY